MMQPYQFHPKSKWWTVAVQLTKVTSCHWVCLCCQFYQHNNYLTCDATKDKFVKFVTEWTFSSYSSVWRGRCSGSDLWDFGYVTLEAHAQVSVDRLCHYHHHYHYHLCTNPLCYTQICEGDGRIVQLVAKDRVARLVEHHTEKPGTLPMQVDSSLGRASHWKTRHSTNAGLIPRPGATRELFPPVNLLYRLFLRCSYSPRIQSHDQHMCAC